MDVPAETMDKPRCSSCKLYLSQGPTYLQDNKAAICGQCYIPKRPATKNKATAKLLTFPCKYRKLGCPETVSYVVQEEENAHEVTCQYKQCACPLLGPARCDWLGPRAAVLTHCRDQHPDRVLENPCSLTHNIIISSCNNYIITAFQLLFLLQTKVCVTSGKIFHAVRLLGAAPKAANYIFNLDIKRNNDQLTRVGQVEPQGCLAIQEPTWLVLNTNSLLSVLGGFHGATFTVTVRVRDAADQLARTAEKCAKCAAEVTVFWYRDEGGWRCKRCAPARRACKGQCLGCTYTDIDDKCKKHERLFCQQRKNCVICLVRVRVSRGTLSAHYSSMHKRLMHEAGSTWLATLTEGRHCLMPSVAGTAVCLYSLSKSKLILQVCIPSSSEQLRDFRCEIRITNPANRHTRTFMPPTLYNQQYDWDIEVKNDKFLLWKTELDVCVDIRKDD